MGALNVFLIDRLFHLMAGDTEFGTICVIQNINTPDDDHTANGSSDSILQQGLGFQFSNRGYYIRAPLDDGALAGS